MALPQIPVGTDPHKDVLDAIQKLSKTVPPTAAVPGVQQSQLLGLQEQARKSAMLSQLAASMGQVQNVPPVEPQ